MDWLSKRKFVIVCHEKVVRIPLEGDEILRVHGEHTLGVAKALMNAKVDEPRISDIPVVRDSIDVFPEEFVELFHIGYNPLQAKDLSSLVDHPCNTLPSCDLVSLDQHAYTLCHLESRLTISLDNLFIDNLDIFKEDVE
ncbi:hypothetical protein Tco_1336955 [Tanacetum coccineum]